MSTGDTPERTRVEPADLVGSTIADRYALTRLVSSGANTTIYDASDRDTGRVVTLKLLRPSIAASPSFRDQFDEQMRSVAAFSHPNVVAVYDWGLAPVGDVTTAYVVTEALGGGSLRDLFDRGRRLSPSQALVVGLDACRGLDYAHRRGFVHTELTPSKLVFGDDRRLRIADFGLARLLGDQVWKQPESVPNHVAGYAAPEQGAGSPLDGRADVYALCLSLHEAVTGVLPFKTDSTVATLAARVGKLMPVSADLGPLAAVFERAGRPDAAERSTAAEFGKGLVQAASKLPRPEPLPLLSTGLFDTPADQMRDPDDPTGGVHRTGEAAVVVVQATPDEPVEPDEPNAPDEAADHDGADDDGVSGAAIAGAAGAAVVGAAAAGVAAARTGDVPDMPEIVAADDVDGAGDAHDADGADALDDEAVDAADGVGEVADGELLIAPVDSELDGGPDAVLPEPAPTVSTDGLVIAADDRSLPPTTTMPAAATVPVEPEQPAKRRGVPWKLLLAAVVAAALIVLGVLATSIFQTPEYEVPDLVGVDEDEARNLIAPNGWDVTVERERSDVIDVPGLVIRTAPTAGVSLAEDEPFLMVVSEGPTLRELPDSTGVPLAEATNRLLERGLVVEVVEEFDEEVPPGTVVSWSVPSDPTLTTGSMVLPDTVVELVVSQGPAPRSVPNVTGVPADQAQAQITELRLVYVESGREFSDDFPAGHVIRQSPQEGVEVPRDSEVSVVISQGPDLVTFPDLSGAANYDEAAQVLTEAGFEPVLVFGDSQGEIRSITIDGEEAVPGNTYRRGTRVEIEAL